MRSHSRTSLNENEWTAWLGHPGVAAMWLATASLTALTGLVGLSRWFNALQGEQIACIPSTICVPTGVSGGVFGAVAVAITGLVVFAVWRALADRPRSVPVRLDGVALEIGTVRIPLVSVRGVGSSGRRLLLDRDGELEVHDLGDDDLALRVAVTVSRRSRSIERVPDEASKRWMKALSSLRGERP